MERSGARRWRWAVAGLAVLAVAAGCAAEDTTGTAPSTTTAVSGAGDPEAAGCGGVDPGASTEVLLGSIPAGTAGSRSVTVADLGAFLDHQGARLPEDRDEVRWVGEPAEAFTPTDLLLAAVRGSRDGDDPLATELGVGVGQIERAVAVGQGPDQTEVLVGRFDPDTVEVTVGSDPYWSTRQELVERDGLTFYSWGADGEVQPEAVSPVRPLGIGGRLWVGDHLVAFTRATAPMEAFLDACTGAPPSLAADEAFAGVARRLDEETGWFNVALTDEVAAGWPDGPPGSAPAPVTDPLRGVEAIGYASRPGDGDQARIRLVVASATEQEAAANEQAFADHLAGATSVATREPWADVVRIRASEVDGRFLVVDLEAENADVVRQSLLRRDNLVAVAP